MNLRARIQITFKPGVLDPQGAAVKNALGALGFDEVSDVWIGKYLEVRLTAQDEDVARRRIVMMCDALLANPVTERYELSLAEELP